MSSGDTSDRASLHETVAHYLADTVGPLGIELEAGHVVLPGSMTRAQGVAPGDTVSTTIAGVGTVTAVLGQEENR